MKKTYLTLPVFAVSALLVACGEKDIHTDDGHGHPHPHGDEKVQAMEEEHDHAHDEVSLGTFKAGEFEVEAAQGHGKIEAGKEGHLVIKLPFKDDGATVVRAWIGTEDRTMSAVGKGDYASSHDDYDIHAIAPSPLPEDVKWWVEIEKPDGSKVIGSVAPKI